MRRTARELVEFTDVFEAVLRASIDRVVVVRGRRTLEDVLRQEHRFVFALNHGPPHLPMLAVAAFQRTLLECGGGRVRAVGIMFRGLYLVPALSRLVRYMTQVDAAPKFDELREGFANDAWNGVVVMPEGANCVFGRPCELQPFTSPRFVELAALVDAPVVIVVHRGLEGHAREIDVPRAIRESAWLGFLPYGLGRILARTGKVALPASIGRLPELRIAIDVHRPSISAAALTAMSADARRAWVAREASMVHAKMVDLHDALRLDVVPIPAAHEAAES